MSMLRQVSLKRFLLVYAFNTTLHCVRLLRIISQPLRLDRMRTQRYAYGFGVSRVLVSPHLPGLVTTTLNLVTSGGMATEAKGM